MYKQVDHIGIAVPSLKDAKALYSALLGKGPDHEETVDEQKVTTAFYAVGETNLELLEPTAPESPIAKFMDGRGGKGGLHHICLRVTDIEGKLAALKAAGMTLIDENPRKGAHNCRVAFVHPKSTGGVLLELSEPQSDGGHGHGHGHG